MFLSKLLIAYVFLHVAYSRKVPGEIMAVWNNITEPFAKDCALEENPHHEHVNTMYTAGYVPDHDSVACYLNCLYRKLGIVKANGEVDIKRMMTIAPYMPLSVSKKCAKSAASETNLCEKSYILGDCIIKAMSF